MDRMRLVAHLGLDEGIEFRPYRCTAGKLTIGIGRNLDDRGITQEEAEFLLNNDIDAVEQELGRIPAYVALDDVRQTAIANMAFNLGVPSLMKFKRMWAAVGQADYASAAEEMLDSKWARQVGPRAHRLARLMREGTFYD